MNCYFDVESFRETGEAMDFAKNWLRAEREGIGATDDHLNLLAWTADQPFHVLGIVLNLIDQVGDDDRVAEQIALGPVEWLCEHCDDEFVPVIREAVRKHPGFAIYTKYMRENSIERGWTRFREPERGY